MLPVMPISSSNDNDNDNDIDAQETQEWLDALEGVMAHEGPERAHFLIEQLIRRAHEAGIYLPFSANTAYLNTIPVERRAQPWRPRTGASHPLLYPLERHRHGAARGA